MPDFIMPNFASASEFMASSTGEVSHGDCGWLVVLAAFHSFAPEQYPLNGDSLAALRDEAIAHMFADPNGAVNIPNLDAYLHWRGVPHQTFCSYATAIGGNPPFAGGFDLEGGLHNVLRRFALPVPLDAVVCVETSTAGAGLPQDEPGVQFHYFGVGGIKLPVSNSAGVITEEGGYWRADGDAVAVNPPSGGIAPLLTTWGEVVATNPVGFIIILGLPAAPLPAPAPSGGTAVSWQAELAPDGTLVGAHDANGAHAGTGDAAIVLAHYAGTTSLIPPGESFWDQFHSVLPLDNDVLILAANDGQGHWSTVAQDHGGEAVAALWKSNQQALAVIVGLRAQLAQAQGASGQMALADALHIVTQTFLQIASKEGLA